MYQRSKPNLSREEIKTRHANDIQKKFVVRLTAILLSDDKELRC